MKRYFALVCLALLALRGSVAAQSLDDQYVRIFNLIQEGDAASSSNPKQALAKYTEAQTALLTLRRGSPDWNIRVVNFRLNYLASRIVELSGKPGAAPPPETSPPATNAPAPGPAPGRQPPGSTAPSDWAEQLNGLTQQVRQLQADKSLLEAKLKEALAATPAAVDPRELAKAQEQVRSLEKETELLKVAVENEKKLRSTGDPKALEEARQATVTVSRERDALQTQVAQLKKDAESAAALREENQLLKKELADSAARAKTGATNEQLAQARAQIAALQSDKELLQVERTALQTRVQQLTAAASLPAVSNPPPPVAESKRVRELERERNDLQKQLEAASKELSSRKGKAAAARTQELQTQLDSARARLEAYELKKAPYTVEELALFKQPEPALIPDKETSRKPSRELSAASAKLVAQARDYFAKGNYAQAESNYVQVVQQDRQNVSALTDLANIQLQANHLDSAEMNLNAALALSPNDAYALSVLGRLKFYQRKFDEALDALSRAAKVDPENAEIQNYLGLVLSEKGLRGPAEAALRKAIQIAPQYGSAHQNLAVVYITQQPPLVELARWHYQKALAAGQPRNPDLEKMLAEKR